MNREHVTERDVKTANQRFYDAVADDYESADGRRSSRLEAWLSDNLAKIRERAPGGRLLDIGTGAGLVTRCAKGLFSWRVGTDLSPKILAAAGDAHDLGVVADADDLPFENDSFDVVTCFSVLHHLYAFEALISEASRVLAPGGIFYCDHDIDAAFYKKFRLLVRLYRLFRDARGRYKRANGTITDELHELSEWHAAGVDSEKLTRLLKTAGFALEVKYHWFGLNPIIDKCMGARSAPRGWAPLLSIIAFKGKA